MFGNYASAFADSSAAFSSGERKAISNALSWA